MTENIQYIYLLIGAVLGFFLTALILFVIKRKALTIISEAKNEASRLIEETRQKTQIEKKAALLEVKDEWYKTKKAHEEEINQRKKEIRILEKKFNERLSVLDKRFEGLDKKENRVNELENRNKMRESELEKKKQELEELTVQQQQKLSTIAQMSREEALQMLKTQLLNEARNFAANDVKQTLEQIKLDANKISAEYLSTAIQRMSVDYVSENTVSVVTIPSEEMKGRIIGREGRNIRTFEKASGVDLIIDDTPEAVVLSCFDPVRREIARLALEKLIVDGRIHPGRIEDLIEKTRKDMDKHLIELGEKACLDLNVHNVSPNIIKLIGRLNYRTSYGQNVLQHSKEAAWICGILAAELGLNQEIARRAGFLHDLGKAIDHEFDGSHAHLGASFARKNGESPLIINTIEAHHEEVPAESAYAPLVQAADAISGARPGARREVLESYMQRLEKLEEIANSLEGVNKCYAIQAGRELRIIVDPIAVDDAKSVYIASDIARKIEQEMQYPGQIKVTVIRETRFQEVAK
ncbi:MAG: ribonuclease Y [Candidatus Cloacimonetes bacterium]|nr:ribonuclease Y [Candidatus Cloacimonadota bacterium]